MAKKKRWVSLISASGSTAAAMIRACGTDRLPNVQCVGVIASNDRPETGTAIRQLSDGPKITLVRRKDYGDDRETFNIDVLAQLIMLEAEIITLNGWDPRVLTSIIEVFEGLAANQHPADPRFYGGSKMTGNTPPCACLQFARRTGHSWYVTPVAQWVHREFDKGDIIKAGRVEMIQGETCSALYKRVKEVERDVQISALNDLANGTAAAIELGNPVWEGEEEDLAWARKQAINHNHDAA
jgi:folate-dependent phosphoribosylglycinamide formyltransferase PurN